MTDVSAFIREVGFPVALTIALCYTLYLLGKTGLALLLEAWRAKDARLGELEKRVETINNGQREALEKRLDQGTEAIHKVSGCLDRMGQAFAEFAQSRPCLHDSDAVRLSREIEEEMTPDPKDLDRIRRQRERKLKREGEAEK